MFEYKMSPEIYFRKVVELYHRARQPFFFSPNIKRGRSATISSNLEDLTAFFISANNPNNCLYFTDQPIKFEGSTTKYPDIVIQEKSGIIKNLVDVKTDIGWNRKGMLQFCKEWEKRIEKIKGKKTIFKRGDNKEIITGKFSKNLKYHILVVTKINSGKTIEADNKSVMNKFKNVFLYILSDNLHPNNYDFTIEETLKKISINHNEFKRFINSII